MAAGFAMVGVDTGVGQALAVVVDMGGVDDVQICSPWSTASL
jgi:hypothetical protein